MIEMNLRGLVPVFVGMTVLSVLGLWKLIEVVAWFFAHIRFA